VGKTATRGSDFEGGRTVSEDATQRDRFASDEDQGEEDVEAHRKHGGAGMTDDDGDDADDVEAHRKHGGA
jgi:hypothetical protein